MTVHREMWTPEFIFKKGKKVFGFRPKMFKTPKKSDNFPPKYVQRWSNKGNLCCKPGQDRYLGRAELNQSLLHSLHVQQWGERGKNII